MLGECPVINESLIISVITPLPQASGPYSMLYLLEMVAETIPCKKHSRNLNPFLIRLALRE